ncbi:hypothetical protein ACFL0V_04350 [Nanoarchaeota archaeon]
MRDVLMSLSGLVRKLVLTAVVVTAGIAGCTNGCLYTTTRAYNGFMEPKCSAVKERRERYADMSVLEFFQGDYGIRKSHDHYLERCKRL